MKLKKIVKNYEILYLIESSCTAFTFGGWSVNTSIHLDVISLASNKGVESSS